MARPSLAMKGRTRAMARVRARGRARGTGQALVMAARPECRAQRASDRLRFGASRHRKRRVVIPHPAKKGEKGRAAISGRGGIFTTCNKGREKARCHLREGGIFITCNKGREKALPSQGGGDFHHRRTEALHVGLGTTPARGQGLRREGQRRQSLSAVGGI